MTSQTIPLSGAPATTSVIDGVIVVSVRISSWSRGSSGNPPPMKSLTSRRLVRKPSGKNQRQASARRRYCSERTYSWSKTSRRCNSSSMTCWCGRRPIPMTIRLVLTEKRACLTNCWQARILNRPIWLQLMSLRLWWRWLPKSWRTKTMPWISYEQRSLT